LKQHGYRSAESRRFQQGQPCHQRLAAIDLVFEFVGFKSPLQKKFIALAIRILIRCCTAAEPLSGQPHFKRSSSLRRQEVTMISAADPIYVAKRQDDGTWSIVDSKTGRIADIGGCVLRRLDAAMAAGLVQDLNDTVTHGFEKVARDQS
jgi:hypothetical protein